ncbi:hypotheical protein [Halarchaeum acidiphilum MH1-52-1]|uniref:Phosphoesterase n=1 Tax=Halarchaeum acidiphilum MH1-52-1 TaxID=1261545 RepID=U2YY19_9EURY|nr:metallophosphoesterase [Halarchaeum acidiphilum]GAD53702.1 hypotheical protein [Halarchaeum acidiphilum MH1-52-1]
MSEVGVVSDTHDDRERAQAAVAHFEDVGCETVIHCGDVVAPFTAAVFASDAYEFHAVRGNNDGEWNLQNAIREFGEYHGESAELTLDGVEFAVYHGTSGTLVDALVACEKYDYVLHGHTHERRHDVVEGTHCVNPGGLPFPAGDDRYHVATIDTDSGDVTFTDLDD